MLKPLSAGDARRLRDFLAASSYSHRTFSETPLLRQPPNRLSDPASLPAWIGEPSARNLLLRLFFFGYPQPREAAGDLLPEPILRLLLEAGMVAGDAAALAPAVMLTPYHDSLFASDSAARMRSSGSGDIVVWPNPASLLLHLFAIASPVETTLDLGAGCGILGILAAPHSSRVVATDLNPRAGPLVAFNAALNGAGNVEYLTGDTYEPVRGRAFDRILANPPFFLTPGCERLYCENSMDLDDYCRRVVREGAQHLAEGGYLQALLEWAQVRGQSWQERLAGWLDGTGCDAWILRRYTRDAAAYAEERIRAAWPHEPPETRLAAWTAYYRERGVEEVHGGMLAMRRRPGTNWLRIEELLADAAEPFGDAVLETFATQDILAAGPTDVELLRMRPLLSSRAQLEQSCRAAGGKWAVTSARLLLTGGAPASLAVEPQVAEFLARCDGLRTLEELARDLAARVGVPPDAACRQGCAVVRTLADRRFLQIVR